MAWLPLSVFQGSYGKKPLNSSLADCPHRHGCESTADGQSPKCVSHLGVWIETENSDDHIKKKKRQKV